MDESRNGITQVSASIDSNHASNSNGITKSKQHDTKDDDHIVTNPIVNSQVPSKLIGNIVGTFNIGNEAIERLST